MEADESAALERTRRTLAAGGDPAADQGGAAPSGVDLVFRAVWAHAHHDVDAARALIDRAAEAAPASLLVRELAAHLHGRDDDLHGLDDDPGLGVYRRPEAFARYIRGGGNVELYGALGAHLREIYERDRPARVLDIGPGDGRAVIEGWSCAAGPVDLVEPSEGLLEAAVLALNEAGVPHRAHRAPVEEFLAADPDRRWPLAQATFSLQSLPPAARTGVVRRLAQRCDRLVVAEFDVPVRDDLFDPTWFLRCVQRVERGLREYGEDRTLVARGFLLPVMLGFFEEGAQTNHEQPTAAWAAELRAAGFSVAEPRLVYDYWWAPAHLLDATS